MVEEKERSFHLKKEVSLYFFYTYLIECDFRKWYVFWSSFSLWIEKYKKSWSSLLSYYDEFTFFPETVFYHIEACIYRSDTLLSFIISEWEKSPTTLTIPDSIFFYKVQAFILRTCECYNCQSWSYEESSHIFYIVISYTDYTSEYFSFFCEEFLIFPTGEISSLHSHSSSTTWEKWATSTPYLSLPSLIVGYERLSGEEISFAYMCQNSRRYKDSSRKRLIHKQESTRGMCGPFIIAYFRDITHPSSYSYIGRPWKEVHYIYVVWSFSIYREAHSITDISRFCYQKRVCTVVSHTLFVTCIRSTPEDKRGIFWLYGNIDNAERFDYLTYIRTSHSSSREYFSKGKVYRRIISLKKEKEKSCEEKNNSPKNSRCSALADDFVLVGFDHSYFRFIFAVVSKVSIRFPKKRRIWLSIAGIEKSVSVRRGTVIHWRIL